MNDRKRATGRSRTAVQTDEAGSVARLWSRLSARRRLSAYLVVALTIVASLLEIVTIGLVIPFLQLLLDPGRSGAPGAAMLASVAAGLGTSTAVVASLALATVALLSGGFRLITNWQTQKFVFGSAEEISVGIYERMLALPYSAHVLNHSSRSAADVNKPIILASSFVLPIVQALSGAFIAASIVVMLCLIDLAIALAVALSFGLLYGCLLLVTRRVLKRAGAVAGESWEGRLRRANDGLGGIRDVILDGSAPVFVRSFAEGEQAATRAFMKLNFLGAAPRFVVEAFGLVAIAIAALLLFKSDQANFTAAVPTLAAFALGAQRLFPLLQQIYGGFAAREGSRLMLAQVATLAALPQAGLGAGTGVEVEALKTLAFRDVVFRYENSSSAALSLPDLTITAGERIGIRGPSGSGKSTLMDLLLGLQLPSEGRIIVNGTTLGPDTLASWRRQVAHVPQEIFLVSGSIADNIAFGVPASERDDAWVERCAEQAQVSDFARLMPAGLDSPVGERGRLLSGGQRQRIGIARALYKKARLLVLDEATSALDTETERQLNESIARLDREITLVVIAHRPSSLAYCERILTIEDGRLRQEQAALP
jgi:ABC-type multidrug transport system fused ATPase/permease subunit